MMNREKAACPQGHLYTTENTYVYRSMRYCRTCGRKQRQTIRNKEAKRSANQRYYAKNDQHIRQRVLVYQVENPDRIRDKAALRRARKTGVFVERVYRSVVFKRDSGLCGICREAVDSQDWHLDHKVPLALRGEHSYANTQVAHPTCNLKKAALHG